MKPQPTEPGFDPKRTDAAGPESMPLSMKECGQSGSLRIHTPDLALGRRATGREFTVASYNVRTLADTKREGGRDICHKLQQLIAGCEKHSIDFLAIQEHRLKSTDPVSFQHHDRGWMLAHTNSSSECHGVAALYSARVAKLVYSVQHKSDRIIATHLEGNPKICIISAYAPTDCSPDASKTAFYNDLSDLVLSISPHTVIITAGDFNARIGMDGHDSNPSIIGPSCLYARSNNNGLRMTAFCEATKLRPAHSHFPNRRSRLYTYVSPKKEPFQLDHIMVSTKWWKSILNCRAFNTIDIGSDHKVVSAQFRISLRSSKRAPNERCKFNWEKLSVPSISKTFNLQLRNCFSTLIDETAVASTPGAEIQRQSDALDTALRKTSEKVLGKKPNRKQPSWVSAETLALLDATNKVGARYKRKHLPELKEQWQLMQGEVSAAFDRDQSAHLIIRLAALELADQKRQSATTWKIINQIAGDDNKADPAKVRRLDGSLPNGKEELWKEWRAYFNALLNNPNANAAQANHPPPSRPIAAIKTTAFSRNEILQAIFDLKRNKSPGPDHAMTAEALKDGGSFIVDQLLYICNLVYENGHAPTQWTSSYIIPLPKKGNLHLMTNWRGICLMSIAAKVYNRMLLNRIRDQIDKVLRKNQAGFREGRSCIQQITILRRIMDGAFSQDIPLFITFVDFKKAFDSIDRDMMFAILRHYSIPQKIVAAIRVLYDESKCQVYLQGQLSEPFKITTGVLQGDVLAPFLFIVVIDYVSKRSAEGFGYLTHRGNAQDTSGRQLRTTTREPDHRVSDLAFADDIALLEGDALQSQRQLDALKINAGLVGLQINIPKTEQMRLNQPIGAGQTAPLHIDGQDIAIVDDFKYLGSYMASSERDINKRIGVAWGAFNKLRSVLCSPKLHISLRTRIFKAACISILLYGCESWVLTDALSDKLDIYARACYRTMLGIKQSVDHITNQELYKRVGQSPISKSIRAMQLNFTGHCIRMDDDEPANRFILYESKIRPSNRPGAPRRTYRQQISSYLLPKGEDAFSTEEIRALAKKKELWRTHFVVPRPKKPPDPLQPGIAR